MSAGTLLKARVVFTQGDYHHALNCYFAARAWVRASGMAMRDGVDGIINSPTFRGEKCATGIIPDDWAIDAPEWQTTIDINCDSDRELAWLRDLVLPEHATLEIL